MKKFFITGAIVFVTTFAFANRANTLVSADDSAGTECPMGCETASPKCCSTKGGSVYYGKL